MYQGGLTAAYGYGRVYREYPQAQLQQVPASPLAQVGAPAIRMVPPWEAENVNAAAEFATVPVYTVVFFKPWIQGSGPIKFPFLGQWHPHDYDAPDATVSLRNQLRQLIVLPVGAPAIRFPFLGQWQPHSYDVPDATIAIRNLLQQLIVLPVGRPPVRFPLPNVDAALYATQGVVYLVSSSQSPVGDRAVKFPPLGQWTPVMKSLDLTYYSPRLPITPPFVPPPPTSLALLGQWIPTSKPLDSSYYSFRIPLALVSAPVAGSEAWLDELANWAALSASMPAVYLAAPSKLQISDASALFVRLGQRMPFEYRFQLVLMPVSTVISAPVSSLPITPAWAAEVANWAAIGVSTPVVYLASPPELQVSDAAALFQRLGQWVPTQKPLDVVYYDMVLPQTPPVVSATIPAWNAELMAWAAYSNAVVPIMLSQQLSPDQPVPLSPPEAWKAELANWAALGAVSSAMYLASLPQMRTSTPITLATPPWIAEAANWPALGVTASVLYLASLSRLPTADRAVPFPPLGQWQPGTMDQKQLSGAILALLRALSVLPVTITIPPPIGFPKLGGWQPGTMGPLWPAALWAQILRLVQPPPPLPVVTPRLWQIGNLAAFLRRPVDYIQILSLSAIRQPPYGPVCAVIPVFMPETSISMTPTGMTGITVGFSLSLGQAVAFSGYTPLGIVVVPESALSVPFVDTCGSPR